MKLDFKDLKKCTFTLSANEIRQYCECPRKRYYSSRDCLAVRANTQNKSLNIGKAVHSALQYYYSGIQTKLDELQLENPTKDDIKQVFSTMGRFDLESSNLMLDAGDVQVYNCVINNYMDQLLDDLVIYDVLGCEEDFSLTDWPVEDVLYHGQVDMLVRDRSDDKIYFFEHKTCKEFRPEVYDRFDIQLHIYAEYGQQKFGEQFGGMILNQLKKAKTIRGYANKRNIFAYSIEEMVDFANWISLKTAGLKMNYIHEPCNNYMTCKMCEYQTICLKYGYTYPRTATQVLEDSSFVNEETGEKLFKYDPREEDENESES